MKALRIAILGLFFCGCASLPLRRSQVEPVLGAYENTGSCRASSDVTVLHADGTPAERAEVWTTIMAVNPLSSRVWRFKGGPTLTNEKGEARVCDPRSFDTESGEGLRSKNDSAVVAAMTSSEEGMTQWRDVEGPLVIRLQPRR